MKIDVTTIADVTTMAVIMVVSATVELIADVACNLCEQSSK